MFTINGVELEIDLMDLDERERFEDCFINTNEEIQKITMKKTDKPIDQLREICDLISDFFDDLFGEGTSDMIFENNKYHIGKNLAAIQEVTKEKIRQEKEFDDMLKESASISIDTQFKPNREQRRLTERKNKKIN